MKLIPVPPRLQSWFMRQQSLSDGRSAELHVRPLRTKQTPLRPAVLFRGSPPLGSFPQSGEPQINSSGYDICAFILLNWRAGVLLCHFIIKEGEEGSNQQL